MTDTPHQCSVTTTAEQRAELIALLDRNASNHEAYRAAIGTKGERRAKAEWKRSSDWLEVYAVGYLRKLIEDVNTLLGRTDLTAATQLHRSGLITPEKYSHIREMIRARSVLQGEAAA